MKKLVALLLCAAVLLPTAALASMTDHQVCIVREKHYGNSVVDDTDFPYGAIFYVYAPTGRGDYWRYCCTSRCYFYYTTGHENQQEPDYWNLQSVGRGAVYQGTTLSIGTDEYDAISGFALSGTVVHTARVRYGTAGTHYIRYNKPGAYTPTHVRVFHQRTLVTSFTVKFYNDTPEQVGDTTTFTTAAADVDMVPSQWIACPSASWSYVEIKYVSGTAVGIFGIDWIDTGTEVSPDTYGAMMFDGPNGDMLNVTEGPIDGTGEDPAGNYWHWYEEEFGPFLDGTTGNTGPHAHGGIVNSNGTLTISTQVGDAEPVEWDPPDNDGTATFNPDTGNSRIVCDSILIDMADFDAMNKDEQQGDEVLLGTVDLQMAIHNDAIHQRSRYTYSTNASFNELMATTFSVAPTPALVRFWPEKAWYWYTSVEPVDAELEATYPQCSRVSLLYGNTNTRIDVINVPMYRRFGAANDHVVITSINHGDADTDLYFTSWLSSGNTYDVADGDVLEFWSTYYFLDTEWDFYPSTKEGSGIHYRGKH